MTETSKLAEEAAVEIHWAHVKKPDAYEQEAIARTRTIIKSAIEKALKSLLLGTLPKAKRQTLQYRG